MTPSYLKAVMNANFRRMMVCAEADVPFALPSTKQIMEIKENFNKKQRREIRVNFETVLSK